VTDFVFARSLMAVSLGFHIIFAVIGMGMPVLMVIAEGRWLRTRDPVFLELTQRWARGTAILFAVGAASGTVLSFELGLLWPRFMELAGSLIGMPFSLEGFAFFTEAIFLGLHLYGWKRIGPVAHWLCGVVVAISGVASATFVVTANAWMNAPRGFRLEDGHLADIDPLAAMMGPASAQQIAHMVLAAYIATGIAVAGVHAFFLLRSASSSFHRRAFRIAVAMVGVSAPLQMISGDGIARMAARLQPAKFAALEAHYETRADAPVVIGGIPDDSAMTVRGAIEVPGLLSLMVGRSRATQVTGLADIPRDLWPDTRVVHLAFDVMVGCGTALFAVALWWILRLVRRRPPDESRGFLRAALFAAPLGFIAIEAGWVVTEVGRQPWIIQGVMRTADAVTPMTGLVVPFTAFLVLYVVLAGVLVFALRDQFVERETSAESTHAA
jgi:cytochrome bd ubiquinol oxidase subunit I